MLRGNLSSRPFYNERLVLVALGVMAAGVVALSAFNFSRLTSLSAASTELEGHATRDRDEAARIRADIRSAVAAVDMNRLGPLVAGAAEANALIAQRTFSWTEFFDVVEGALPYEVRLVGVSQRVEDDERVLVMSLVAQTDRDLNDFVRAMLDTGVFFDVLPTEKAQNDDGTVGAIVETHYLPQARPASAESPGGGRGGRP